MKKDIILAGVGGQGILTIATIIGEAAAKAGVNLKQAEVHGMSQRGGDVQSTLRLSTEPIYSDLIREGAADLIISMEPMEALRYVPYLDEEGWIVTSSHPFKNIPNYPDEHQLMAELEPPWDDSFHPAKTAPAQPRHPRCREPHRWAYHQ